MEQNKKRAALSSDCTSKEKKKKARNTSTDGNQKVASVAVKSKSVPATSSKKEEGGLVEKKKPSAKKGAKKNAAASAKKKKQYWEKNHQRFKSGNFAGKTFKDVALSDPDYYERYKKNLRKRGKKPSGEIAEYLEWYYEAICKDPDILTKQMVEDLENRQFDFGRHCGETFRQVAQTDPGYHERYLYMNPGEAHRRLGDYMEYFQSYGRFLPTHQVNQREGAYASEDSEDYYDDPIAWMY